MYQWRHQPWDSWLPSFKLHLPLCQSVCLFDSTGPVQPGQHDVPGLADVTWQAAIRGRWGWWSARRDARNSCLSIWPCHQKSVIYQFGVSLQYDCRTSRLVAFSNFPSLSKHIILSHLDWFRKSCPCGKMLAPHVCLQNPSSKPCSMEILSCKRRAYHWTFEESIMHDHIHIQMRYVNWFHL